MYSAAKKALTCFACVFPFFAYPFVVAPLLVFGINGKATRSIKWTSRPWVNEQATESDASSQSWPLDSPQYFSHQASDLLASGKIEDAIAAFGKAIEHNADDFAASYQVPSPKAIPPSNVKHGWIQVRKMLDDRPEMTKHTDESDFLCQWAARKFAGEDLPDTIDWDPTLPTGAWAEHVVPDERERGRVRVSSNYGFARPGSKNTAFESQWSAVIFELHNITRYQKFQAAFQASSKGTISKEAYVRTLFCTEFEALQQTRGFYVHEFLPWSRHKSLQSNSKLWFTSDDWWGTADQCFRQYSDPYSYPWTPYGDYYDRLSGRTSDIITRFAFNRGSFYDQSDITFNARNLFRRQPGSRR